MFKIGIMQGRLHPVDPQRYQLFPKKNWKIEFSIAQKLGFNSFEWLIDVSDYKHNPLLQDNLLPDITRNSKKYNILLQSVCADYFKIYGFINISPPSVNENLLLLNILIRNCSKIGIRNIVIPFLENNKITGIKDMMMIKKIFSPIYPFLKKEQITLCLETELNSSDNIHFMKIMESPNIRLQYDTGNAAGLGHLILEEITKLKDIIGGIHIKDKDSSGNNVTLGSGMAHIKETLILLKKLCLCDNYILETTMGNNPVESAKYNLRFAQKYLL